jgi:hypothetical protein
MKARNQKLTNEQIATIFYLDYMGFTKSVIARSVKDHCGVSLSVTYYHLDKIEQASRIATVQLIRTYLQEGYTTSDISKIWGIPLEEVNKMYVGKRVN